MDIFTAHPVLLWATVACICAIALYFLLPILLSVGSLIALLAVAFFGGIFALFTHLFDKKGGLWAVVIVIILIAVTILCFVF